MQREVLLYVTILSHKQINDSIKTLVEIMEKRLLWISSLVTSSSADREHSAMDQIFRSAISVLIQLNEPQQQQRGWVLAEKKSAMISQESGA